MVSKGRKRLRILLVVLLLLAGVWFIVPMVVAPILRQRLEAMVASNLNARLTMDGLTYHFPYGLVAHNAALVTMDSSGRSIDLLRVERLNLDLAEIPWGSRPLVIERISIVKPSVHLVLDPEGLAGFKNLVRPPSQGPPGKEKPSDYFRLRALAIREGQILYEDRRKRKDLPPLAWRNITIELRIEPQSGSLYGWEITARNGPLATANTRGRIDIDKPLVEVEKFVLAGMSRRRQAMEELPPEIQETLNRFEVEGRFTLTGRATLPLMDLGHSSYEATAQLSGVSHGLAEYGGKLDRVFLKATFASEPPDASPPADSGTEPAPRPDAPPMPSVQLDKLELASGDTVLRVEKGVVTIDPAQKTWRVGNLLCRLEVGGQRSLLPTNVQKLLDEFEISGKLSMTAAAMGPLVPQPDRRFIDQVEYQVIAYPRDLSVKPRGFAQPITGGAGMIRATGQVVSFENVEANCGEDHYFIKAARIPLENVTHELQVLEITGTARLSGKVEGYPRPLDFIAREIRPMGEWNITGNWARRLSPKQPPEFWFDISTERGGALLSPKRIPLTDVRCDMSATRQLVDIRSLQASSLDGEVRAQAQVKPGHPASYSGVIWIRDVDVRRLAQLLVVQKGRPPLVSGKGNLNATFSGVSAHDDSSGLDGLQASGRFEILEGDFWEAPVLSEVVSGTKVARDALGTGQAAGAFDIARQQVNLKDTIVASPVFGLQGEGRVGFDGQLDLRTTAAPLADWKDQMKRTKIPVVSDVAGEVLGGLQKILNTASKTLLYQFNIKGTTRDPRITAVPTPALTEPLARLFDGLIKGKKVQELAPPEGPRRGPE